MARRNHPLRRRLQAWLRSRMPRTDDWRLTQRNLYVLPSGIGLMLAVTALLLLIASINYQINLGFLFTFMLAGVTFVSILVAHGNLRGLRLRAQAPGPAFAHLPSALPLVVEAPAASKTRFAIALRTHQQEQDRQRTAHPAGEFVDVAGDAPVQLQLALPPLPRGLHPCPIIAIETYYPLGAFRVWSLWQPAAELLVYPAPEPNAPPLPQSQAVGEAGIASTRADSFENEGFRAYQRGDPMRTILWKKTATALVTGHGDWVRRDQTQVGANELWLEHSATGLQQPEAVLARLCAWVLQADAQGLTYGLRLPHTEIAPGQGGAHKHQCLKALALS